MWLISIGLVDLLMMLTVIPASREDVSRFVTATHRHHKPSPGDVFRLACVDETGKVRGVATIGRPVARMSDDGWTLEVNRVATDGARNACSLLYGAARKVAFTMGYRRLLTYTLESEGGASLRAAGWTCEGEAGGGDGWLNREGRSTRNQSIKVKWSALNVGAFAGEPLWPEVEIAQMSIFSPSASHTPG